MSEWRLIVADTLVVAGLTALTVAVVGLVRIPDAYTKLHASSKAVIFGDLVVLGAALFASDAEVAARALLVGGFLLVTATVSTHALARLHRRGGEPPTRARKRAPADSREAS